MLEKLTFTIKVKKYATHQEIVDRLNSFNVWGQVTPEEYNTLMTLAETVYNPPVEVLPTEPIV